MSLGGQFNVELEYSPGMVSEPDQEDLTYRQSTPKTHLVPRFCSTDASYGGHKTAKLSCMSAGSND